MAYTFTKKTQGGLSDGRTIAVLEVTPDGATGNITLSGSSAIPASTIDAILGCNTLSEDPAANAQVAVQASIDGTTANKLNFKLWQATNSAAAAFKTFQVGIICS